MKLVYSAMFEGLSFTSVQRFCALYDMPLVSKRQFLKYKKCIASVARKKTMEHLEQCSRLVTQYYENELSRLPDDDGILDVDVTYDGKLFIILSFPNVIITRKVKRMLYTINTGSVCVLAEKISRPASSVLYNTQYCICLFWNFADICILYNSSYVWYGMLCM